MTLNEVIQYAEEMAEKQEKEAKRWKYTLKEKYKACAEEYRQLAEWLKDYKRMKACERGYYECKHLESAVDESCWTCDENYSNWESEK